MLNRRTLLIVVVLAVSLAVFASLSGTTDAQPRLFMKFENVEVFTYASGLTGFFNRETGVLYIYDSRWDKCTSIRRLDKLGSPMVNLRKSGR